MVHSDQRIFHGELTKDSNCRYSIFWRDFEYSSNTLNPNTLMPDIIESQSEEEKKDLEILEEANSDVEVDFGNRNDLIRDITPMRIEMIKQPLINRRKPDNKKKLITANKIDIENSTPFIHMIDDDDEEFDTKPPWYQELNNNYTLAISGIYKLY
jgi:hypothetical protein